MRRATGLSMLLLLVLVCALALGSTPRSRLADAQDASPAGDSSPVASPTGAVCEAPSGIDQEGQLEGRTTRQAFLSSTVAEGIAVGYRLEAGRICIEPGVVIPDPVADCPPPGSGDCPYLGDGNDYVLYTLASTVYLEQGRLMLRVRAGSVLHYADPGGATPVAKTYRATVVGPGEEIELGIGDSVLIENAEVKIWNPDATQPTVIFATGFHVTKGAPGCGGTNCWIPS